VRQVLCPVLVGRDEEAGHLQAALAAADAVRRRLDAVDADSRHVLGAAAVLGRRFDWALLSPVTGMTDAAVVAALRRGVGLQLVAADRESFRFRHALTHEAVLAALLPPERTLLAGRALAAVEAAHPGLPGAWCMLAADLAERAGDTARAGALLLEAGRRDLAVGALASAKHTLARAQALTGPGEAALRTPVDEALAEVFAMSGQVDRAIEMGRTLLARLGPGGPSAPAANLHLGIARAVIAGARWADAAASIEVTRGSPGADAAQVGACAAQVAIGQGRLAEADQLARAALRAAEGGGLPEVVCEALEVIGRVARQRDLQQAERAFARAAAVASAHGLQLWHARALHELGTIDQLRAAHTAVPGAIGDPGTTIVDVRSEAEYRGSGSGPPAASSPAAAPATSLPRSTSPSTASTTSAGGSAAPPTSAASSPPSTSTAMTS
jgi:tetratricopeptide (TPR) repeat protein